MPILPKSVFYIYIHIYIYTFSEISIKIPMRFSGELEKSKPILKSV